MKKILKLGFPIIGLSSFLVLSGCTYSYNPQPPTPPETDTCKVSFVVEDSFIKSGSKEQKIDKGTTFGKVNKPYVENSDGFTTIGWCDQSGVEIDSNFAITSDLSVYPIWAESTTCLVTFNIKDSELKWGNKTEIVTKGLDFYTINMPTVEKEHYNFIGWTDEDGSKVPISSPFTVDDDLDVYPIWELKSDISDADNIIAIDVNDEQNKYLCNVSSLCSFTDKIILTPIPKTNNQTSNDDGELSIKRDEFQDYRLEIGKNIAQIPNNFLINCENFNQTITFTSDSNLTYIGQSFLANCINFNQELQLPNNLKYISNDFLGNCENFNNGSASDFGDEFVIPNSIAVIGIDFLHFAYKFNCNITLGENLIFLGNNCMNECNAFCSVLTLNTAVANVDWGVGNSWSSGSETAKIYSPGFTVKTTVDSEYVTNFKKIYPNLTGPELYRTVNTEL